MFTGLNFILILCSVLVKSLTSIILVIQELNFVIQDCDEWRFERSGGGVGRKWVYRILYLQLISQSSCPLQQLVFVAH